MPALLDARQTPACRQTSTAFSKGVMESVDPRSNSVYKMSVIRTVVDAGGRIPGQNPIQSDHANHRKTNSPTQGLQLTEVLSENLGVGYLLAFAKPTGKE
jgi:hypothetical protein